MKQQQEQELLAEFRRMNAPEREHALSWISNFVPPKERTPRLRLVVNIERKQQ